MFHKITYVLDSVIFKLFVPSGYYAFIRCVARKPLSSTDFYFTLLLPLLYRSFLMFYLKRSQIIKEQLSYYSEITLFLYL